MYFVLTTAGQDFIEQHQGYLPTLDLFKLGSASNYLPSENQTSLVGTPVYTGVPSAPVSINQNTIRYTVFIDYNAPTFSFGEVILYLPGNIPFAIGTSSAPILKSQLNGMSQGSSLAIDCYIPSTVTTGYYPYANLANSSNELTVQSVGSIDLLPPANEAIPNIYSVVSAASDRQSTIAISDNALWSVAEYTMYTESVYVSGVGSYTVDLAFNPLLPLAIPNPNGVYGDVLIQFTDGRAVGVLRVIRGFESIGNVRRYTFDTPLTLIPNIGDSVRIYVKTLQGDKYWNLLSSLSPNITSSHINQLVADPVTAMVRLDGTKPMQANLSFGDNRLTNLANPIANQDAINLQTLVSRLNDALEVVDHNSTVGIQGGTTTERYHTTSAEHTRLSAWTANGIQADDLPLATTDALGIAKLSTTALTAAGTSGLVVVTPSSLSSAINAPSLNTLQTSLSNKIKELNPLVQTGTGLPNVSTPTSPSLYIDITTPTTPVSYAYNVPNATWYKIASVSMSGQPISGSSLTISGHSILSSLSTSGIVNVANVLNATGTSNLTGDVVVGTNANNLLTVKSTPTFNTNLTINGAATYPIRIGSGSSSTNIGMGQGATDAVVPLSSITTGSNNVAIGKGAGGILSTGGYNVLVGSGAGQLMSTATNTTFVGNDAGRASGGSFNTGVGNSSLNNASGSGNTAVGAAALFSTTTGNNTGVGYQAGQNLNVGTGNTILGRSALFTATNGNYNTAIGHNSLTLLNNNNNPGPCTAVGYGTLASLTTGGNNTVIGYNALASAITTSNTVAIGNSALATYTGSGDMIFVGSTYTGYNIPNTASNSVVIGSQVSVIGSAVTSGNVSIGYQVGLSGSNNITLGTYARGETSSLMSGNVTIGHYSSIAEWGAITQATAIGFQSEGYGAYSVAIGASAKVKFDALRSIAIGNQSIVYGNSNIALGFSSGVDYSNTVASTACIAIGLGARAVGVGSIAIGNDVKVTASNAILIGSNGTNATVNSVVIGSPSHTSYKIYTANWTNISDVRDKKDVQSLRLGLDLINRLRPVKFKWNLRDGGRVDDADSGFIAQEVLAAVGPEASEYFRVVDASDSEQLRLSSSYLIPVLVNAVQELTAELELMKREIRKV